MKDHQPDSEVLRITDESGVFSVTLNRPDVNNAFDDKLIHALIACFKELSEREDCKIVVLQSEGKHFSAGADLNWMKRMATLSYEENVADANQLAKLMQTIYFCNKPVIAKVQGAAYGGAIGLIACCDIAIAAENASFCLSEVKLGLAPAVISPFVINTIGTRKAGYYFLTAEVFNAQQAKEMELIHEVSADTLLDEKIQQLTEKLIANGPKAMQASKKLIRQYSAPVFNDALFSFTSGLIAGLRVSPEGQEGMSAFFEKRKPAWKTA
ncbi:MAG: gamma-carboxygeranoyl-CoA hydratase [Gammaproteobacteria bacterium]|nr:MAG: gamma-carboxygeranoyl-CoA hydratase [Gammaproteobacteria bacterium]